MRYQISVFTYILEIAESVSGDSMTPVSTFLASEYMATGRLARGVTVWRKAARLTLAPPSKVRLKRSSREVASALWQLVSWGAAVQGDHGISSLWLDRIYPEEATNQCPKSGSIDLQ